MSLLDNASLVLTPSAYKEGKLYSVIPSNGNGDFTATRATTATRVNAAGLVDLVPYNLAQYSEQFENATWTKIATSVTSNTTTAPDGALTADSLNADGSSAIHQVVSNNISFTSATSYTLTAYAKKNTNNFVQIYVAASVGGMFANFDLNNGAVGTLGTITGTAPTSSITSVGNGWYRCSMTFTAAAAASAAFALLISSSASAARLESNSLSTSVFVWGAQVVEGTSARDYLRTETRLNIPRVDYSLGGCPNILLEPQRTNLALQSSSFDSATWAKAFTIVTANTATSPSGIQDADTLAGDGQNTRHDILQTSVATLTSGVTYTTSIYAKKNTNNFIQIVGGGTPYAANTFANFDLNNGTLGSTGGGATSTITSVGNGWYRCTMTAVAINTTTVNTFIIALITSATSVRSEVSTLSTSVFLWGAQLEAGAYSTSFIPTTTASVTRNLDVVQDLGVSSLIGQTEGTIYWEGTLTSGLDDIFYLNRSVTNSVLIYKSAINNITFRIYYGAAFLNVSAAPSYTGTVKIAAAYKSGDSIMYINGVQVATSATAFTFTGALNDVVLNNSSFFFGNQTKSVKELALFKTRLTNAQLAALTA